MATSSRDASRRKSAEIVRNRELLRIARSLLRSKNPEILEGLYTGYIFTAAVCVSLNGRLTLCIHLQRRRLHQIHGKSLQCQRVAPARTEEFTRRGYSRTPPVPDGARSRVMTEEETSGTPFEETYELVLPELLTRAFTFYSGVFT